MMEIILLRIRSFQIVSQLFLEQVFYFMIAPYGNLYYIFQFLFIAISAGMVVLLVYFLLTSGWLKWKYLEDWTEMLTFKPYGAQSVANEWKKIIARLNTGLESEYKLAVIEADTLFDESLLKQGFGGNTLGDKLKELNEIILPNLERLREAHQIRNNIVHDPDYKLSLDEAKRIINTYKEGFQELQLL